MIPPTFGFRLWDTGIALLKSLNTFPSFFSWKGSGKCVLEAQESQQVWRGKERTKEKEKC